jgi:hypothetical protein
VVSEAGTIAGEGDTMTAALLILPAAAIVLSVVPPGTPTHTRTPTLTHQAEPAARESPFACDRLALDPAARKRHFDELGPALRRTRTGVRELSDGYEFEFPGDSKTYALINEWAVGERLCCPFFDITVRADREHGTIRLQLTGRPGTKTFIKGDFDPWFRK